MNRINRLPKPLIRPSATFSPWDGEKGWVPIDQVW
jgi:hypothetical protein